jgi:hypothetical protein
LWMGQTPPPRMSGKPGMWSSDVFFLAAFWVGGLVPAGGRGFFSVLLQGSLSGRSGSVNICLERLLAVPATLEGFSLGKAVFGADSPGTVLQLLYLRSQARFLGGLARNCGLLVTFLRIDCLRTFRPGPKARLIRRLVRLSSRVRGSSTEELFFL